MRELSHVAMTERGLKSSKLLVEMDGKLAIVLQSGNELVIVDKILAVREALLNEMAVKHTLRVDN